MSLSLEDFKTRMRTEVERTRKIRSVQITGHNLEDALSQASLELSLPLRVLEYEILHRGSKGILGLNRSPCRIVAYEKLKVQKESEAKSRGAELDIGANENNESQEDSYRDGRYSIRLASNGAMLKVFPAIGTGVPVTRDEIAGNLQSRGVLDIDMQILISVCEQADQMWVKVGNFEYFPENNAMLSLEISEDVMKALITIQKPTVGGADASAEDINGLLAGHGVVHGILENVVQELEAFPAYDFPHLIAQGTAPINGNDAKILYHFETNPGKVQIKEDEEGTVDFKELNRIQNVVIGQVLARKIAPEVGLDGQNLRGVNLPARDGNDRDFPIGRNVAVGDNGSTVVASVNGHVIFKSGKINVETVLLIPGNVDIHTGNVEVLGSVDIKGNVEDGYSVKAQGNIEVSGYVSKANLHADGDIIVSRGINGGDGHNFGYITAGGNIWTSYIQNANAKAGEFIIVSSGIVNSDVIAQKKVLCKGKKAQIVGGHVCASEEVNAVVFGSTSGVKTVIEVGFDPKIKEELDQFNKEREEFDEVRSSIHLKIQGLIRQVRIKKISLSKEKKNFFRELQAKFNDLNKRLARIDNEIHKRQTYLNSLLTFGKMSASSKVMTGVVLRIKDVEYVIRETYDHGITFVLDGEYIRTTKYQDIKDDITRR